MARNCNAVTAKKTYHRFFHSATTFRGHFCLEANDIARNRSRVIFCSACVDIFCRWSQKQWNDIAHEHTIICRQLFAGHMVSSPPMKRKKHLHRMIIKIYWTTLRRICELSVQVARRSIICFSLLRDTDKSRYFAIIKFNNGFIFQSPIVFFKYLQNHYCKVSLSAEKYGCK